ncbi:MAG: glycoside hydrolase family 26 protein [Synergistaceae bacterium]|nr:glycoside hydrolase family 26 protein [Synergistaceae bacterium]
MCRKARFFSLILLALLYVPAERGEAAGAVKLAPPENGVYHSGHPDFGTKDDAVTAERVRAFTDLAGEIVWAYVSFHWDDGLEFPWEACRELHGQGVVPLVGIMPERYTLAAILRGEFDDEIASCAEAVRSLGFPIMMEFGPEANGSWFPWSGAWNGRDGDEYGEKNHPDGPERFRDAYRRVVGIFRASGALDITWVFHISSSGSPKDAWNSASYYYPGDEWIDWIGASLYGRLRGDEPAVPFDEAMGKLYPGLCALSPSRPIAILELGVSDSAAAGDKAAWIRDAMASVVSGRYPRLRAVSWWNKIKRPDGTRSTLEIDSSPGSLRAYREGVKELVSVALWERR